MSDSDINPITLSVIRNRLKELVNEMDASLVQSAFSPIICEANDMANGIYRPGGNTVAQGENGLPIFAGNMQFTIASISRKFEGDINSGDLFITNDPYIGGTHLMDMKLVNPYFVDGDLLAFIGSTGHWSDIGGIVPGGFSPQTTEIFNEGLRIPPAKLYEEGDVNDALFEVLFSNVRNPAEIRGDFKAQLNALSVGEERLDELIADNGAETLTIAIEELEHRSELQMRSNIESIPDGTYSYTDYIDNDGIVNEPLPIKLEMTIDGSDIVLNFEGSAPQCRGPLNIPKSCTVSACNIAFKHTYPDIPINAGCFEPLDVRVPANSFLNAAYPSPTVAYTETSQRVLDVVFSCLGQAIPDRVPAQSFSTAAVLVVSGDTQNSNYIMTHPGSGGYGATKDTDGLTYCTPPYARAQSPEVEVLESKYPIEFLRKHLRTDSGGAGRQRGGVGTTYEFEILDDGAKVSIVADRADYTPSGVAGGKSAAGTEISITRSGEEYIPSLRSKDQDVSLTRGDSICMKTPGGGGYGPPEERKSERVLQDVRRGFVSPERARKEYGVSVRVTDDGVSLERDTATPNDE